MTHYVNFVKGNIHYKLYTYAVCHIVYRVHRVGVMVSVTFIYESIPLMPSHTCFGGIEVAHH
jgi:hypothetical protein